MLYKALIKKGYRPLTDNIRELLSMMGFDVIAPSSEKNSASDTQEKPDLVVDMVDEELPYEEFMEIYGGYHSTGIPTILITDTEFNSNLVNNLPDGSDISILSRPFTYEKLKKAAIPKVKKNDPK
ncbi:hypothetical protein DN752_19390 [Echinicola strongylocentroti]|uniref:Response regulatory domain-containing protein n=1 Tax=Echinicola strongylocentroti TaxID=1795355 RepID=A0A2Z4INA6_9BACT|nr:hypothetical protein [Echinicola strongylocentroti]AWW32128.1 hypothetical protein DN752_19390 [Echinicola strongylocentroti]